MKNFLKGLIPNILIFVGTVINYVFKLLNRYTYYIVEWGILLHIKFNTEEGKKYANLQRAINEAVDTVNTMLDQIEQQGKPITYKPKSIETKLVEAIKSDNVIPIKKEPKNEGKD